jgi:hypothetical protein
MLTAIARIAGARLVIGLIVAGAVGVGGFFLRDFTSGDVTDLKAGDCFDMPSVAVDVISEVQHHPCNESHTAEIVGVVDYPSADGGSYPGREGLRAYATNRCVAFFVAYTGRDPFTDPDLTVGWMLPTEDGWDGGDHAISCHLFRVDEGPMTQSYRVS